MGGGQNHYFKLSGAYCILKSILDIIDIINIICINLTNLMKEKVIDRVIKGCFQIKFKYYYLSAT